MNSEKLLYFAYASNLDRETFQDRIKGEFAFLGIAVLRGYGFRFNHPNRDGSARGNIIISPNENVYGAVYQLENENKSFLMDSEPGYEWIKVPIKTYQGVLEAYTFSSKQNVSAIYPEAHYMATILKGAKELGIASGYLAQLINRAGPSNVF